ncbi:MAG: hypothetical protein U0457_12805 [Candidatus Sericytochromatia bacterium]
MSELDDELEDLEPSSAIATDDGFDDPKQTTAALTTEINKLRQKNELLRQFNVRQKDKYKHEVRSFLSPVLEKYKDIQSENDFLRNQIKELSQKIIASPLLVTPDNLPEGQDLSGMQILQNAYNEKEKEVAVLNKMVKNMEEDVHNAKKNVAEIPALRELIKQKEEAIRKLEQEKFDLNSKVEAKDKMVEKYLKQINELETNVYVLNKKVTEMGAGGALAGAAVGAVAVGALDSAKINEYEQKLKSANEKAASLENRVKELENQISEYQETMDSLEQELQEDAFMNGNSHDESHEEYHAEELPVENFADEVDFAEELPSDEDLLADDIELDELPLDDELMEELPVDDLDVEEVEASAPAINFEKSETEVVDEVATEDDDILGDFDLSMDSLDEDRDTKGKK